MAAVNIMFQEAAQAAGNDDETRHGIRKHTDISGKCAL